MVSGRKTLILKRAKLHVLRGWDERIFRRDRGSRAGGSDLERSRADAAETDTAANSATSIILMDNPLENGSPTLWAVESFCQATIRYMKPFE